ncbi:trichohyalin isoform X4 [Gadus morhua]|uniref:trichohyalin isoform X4 n=1 Tax=Gadus morhua TaxID=8049 RepID=UPI0011B43987|nr:trichohyalin-like isoform X4 [Gadus morhua]
MTLQVHTSTRRSPLEVSHMAEESYTGSGDADDTDELLYTDGEDNRSMLDLNPLPLRLDPCDLLMDSIDVQLSRLQVQNQKNQESSGGLSGCDEAPFSRQCSGSRDTGLGTPTTSPPISCLQPGPREAKGPAPGKTRPDVSQGAPPCPLQRGAQPGRACRSREQEEAEEGAESRREQCLWRLGRLLGDPFVAAGVGRTPAPPPLQPDSFCTEDLLRCSPEESVEGEEGWWAGCSSQGVREQGDVVDVTRGGPTGFLVEGGRGARVLRHPPLPQPQPPQTHGRDNMSSSEERHSCDVHRTEERQGSGETKAGQRQRGSQKTCDYISSRSGLSTPDTQAPVPPCSHKAAHPESRGRRNKGPCPEPRGLAGGAMWGSDSVCPPPFPQTLCSRTGWPSFMPSIQNTEGYCSDRSDDHTPTPAPGKGGDGGSAFRQARQTRRATPRYGRSTGGDEGDEDTDEGHCSRRSKNQMTLEVQLEKMKCDGSRMEDVLRTLRHKCETEEGKLELRREALRESESSISDAQQKTKELAQICTETAQMELEGQELDTRLRERKPSLQLCGLRSESCLQPIGDMEEEPGNLRRMTQDGCHAETKAPGLVVSILERLDTERQLDSTKTQLFAEKRRSRDKLDSMQERLDEAEEELQRAREEQGLLRSRIEALEEEQRQKQELVVALQRGSGGLRGQLVECKERLGSLEKIVAQKDLQIICAQEVQEALRAARNSLQGELQTMTLQHCKVGKMVAEEKDLALREQAEVFTRQLESAQTSLKLSEDVARGLRGALHQQEETGKKREEQMHDEAKEKVRKASEVEKENMAALQQLQERNQEALEGARRNLEEERKNSQALQKRAAELQTKVEELEGACCFQKREQDAALAMLHSSLTEERRAELKRQRRHMEQELAVRLRRLEETGQLAQREAERLRREMGEREESHQRTTAMLEQQLRQVTQGLVAEGQQLCLLVDQGGSRGEPTQLPQSPTAAQACQYLHDLRVQLQNFIHHLHQELQSQKQNASRLKHAQEQELCIQREKMEMEKQQALHSLKERLIQEHVEELSRVRRGPGASLRRQRQATDQEVRQVQSSRGRLKSLTGSEEKLPAEGERRIGRSQERKPRRPDGATSLAGEVGLKLYESSSSSSLPPVFTRRTVNSSLVLASSHQASGDSGGHRLVADPSCHAPGSPPRPASDPASLRILHHLRSRIRELRAEGQSGPSPAPPRQGSDLLGSYLETVRPPVERTRTACPLVS